MAKIGTRSAALPETAGSASWGTAAPKNQDLVKRFTWVIASIGVHLEELRYFWAKALGISGPQWMIVMALADLDQGDGVPVNVVSKKLHVDSSFVTTQSKLLEKKGYRVEQVSRASGPGKAGVAAKGAGDKTKPSKPGQPEEPERKAPAKSGYAPAGSWDK